MTAVSRGDHRVAAGKGQHAGAVAKIAAVIDIAQVERPLRQRPQCRLVGGGGALISPNAASAAASWARASWVGRLPSWVSVKAMPAISIRACASTYGHRPPPAGCALGMRLPDIVAQPAERPVTAWSGTALPSCLARRNRSHRRRATASSRRCRSTPRSCRPSAQFDDMADRAVDRPGRREPCLGAPELRHRIDVKQWHLGCGLSSRQP